MKKWLLLLGAILCEVTATLSLRASVDDPSWTAVVVAGYILSFTCLGFALREGMGVGVAYGIWGATGVALVALMGMVLFGETLSIGAMVGIAIIIVGVVLVETGSGEAEVSEGARP